MTFRLLRADEIDVKVKQVTEKGAIALLYKTARTDMAILDETFGVMNWTDDYKEIKGNLYCGIGVRELGENPFIWKWDCGIESREDDEGNQKKGEASDAFKRAGSKLGIGRELYTSPFIFLKVETTSDGKKWQLKNKFQTFSVNEIGYDDKRNINRLVIVNDKNEVVFTFGKNENKPKTAPSSQVANKVVEESEPERINILTVQQARDFEFDMKGKTYKVGECTNEQLFWLRDNAKGELLEAVKLHLMDKGFTGNIK
jgi:hypothetical protein